MALLGAHVSTSGGLEKAPERGVELGCQTIQIFTRNQMRWHSKPLTDEEIERYHKTWKDIAKGFPVLAHDSYLINLGSPDKEKLETSRQAFVDELDRAEKLGISYLVFHPGAHLNEVSEEKCARTIAESLNWVIQQCPETHTQILIENTAGQGSNIGYQFKQIAQILEHVEALDRLGVCFDTCHALAAGYDFRTQQGYQQVMAEFDKIIGLNYIKAFHLNDSKKPLGSRVDRHENIGQGFVGKEAFQCIVNDSRFLKTPMVLETPGGDIDYKENLKILRSLILSKRA